MSERDMIVEHPDAFENSHISYQREAIEVAYQRGLAEGRRKGLMEAADICNHMMMPDHGRNQHDDDRAMQAFAVCVRALEATAKRAETK